MWIVVSSAYPSMMSPAELADPIPMENFAKERLSTSPESNGDSARADEGKQDKEARSTTVTVLDYTVDAEKNLSKTIDDKKILVQKLSKAVYKMLAYEGKVYLADVAGDCFVIKDKPRFLLGILSQPKYFTILNDRIYLADKYSRVWVYDLDGEILNIAFIGEGIVQCHICDAYCAVTTDGEPSVIEYHNPKTPVERKLMMFDYDLRPLKTIDIEGPVVFDAGGVRYQKKGVETYLELV